jgi:hypothetical protein
MPTPPLNTLQNAVFATEEDFVDCRHERGAGVY